MNKISKLKIYAATTAFLFPLACTYNMVKTREKNTIAIECIQEETTESITHPITETTEPTTLPTTEPTTIDKYRKIRNLEILKNNDLSIEELDDFIIKYADYSKLTYEESLKAINDNLESIENNYESIRGGIMCTLFTYSNEIGNLSAYTENREIREEMTQEEKEKTMLEFCDNLCMCTNDKYIVLSAFREETGCGKSRKCVYDNNYGGIRIYGEAGCNGQYGKYSTPEFGIYREVKLVNKKLTDIRESGIENLDSIVYAFARRYNPDHTTEYSRKIMNWVYNVQDDYGDFSKEKTYIKK